MVRDPKDKYHWDGEIVTYSADREFYKIKRMADRDRNALFDRFDWVPAADIRPLGTAILLCPEKK